MASRLDLERLSLAFQSRPDLVEKIQGASDSPARISLFNNITEYIFEQLYTGDERVQKRRRVDDGDTNGTGNGVSGHAGSSALPTRQAATAGNTIDPGTAAAAETVLLEIKDISVSIPQRKKYDLCFTRSYLYARASGNTTPVPGIVYAWEDIEHVFCLPVPEKAQIQYNYILLPQNAALASLSKISAAANTTPVAEPLVFTVPAAAPKPGSFGGPSAGLAASVSDSYTALFHWAIEGQLLSVGNRYMKRIVAADPKIFHSVARQPFRPQEKAVHVRAFRGSKDGYLFFLPTGIFWGFKKPLLFIPLDRIVAVSYTNVLQRTFNIAVEVDVGHADGTSEEIEFGMLDQEDYGGIDETYMRRHGLQDRSMAERRKAKQELVENSRGEMKKRAGETNGEDGDEGAGAAGAEEDDGLTELQRAERQLQDEEDEMEEDYDPGSGSDSDGSGASSDEDGEGDEGEEGEDGKEGEGGDEDEGEEGKGA